MLNRILCKGALVSLVLPILCIAVLLESAWSSDVYRTTDPPLVLEVSLKIINEKNAAGDILVVSGKGVIVEFLVKDRLRESSPRDIIRLRRSDNGEVVSAARRGVIQGGATFLKLDVRDCPCKCALIVEYLHVESDTVLATADNSVLIVEDSFARSLMDEISELEVRAMN